MMRVWIVACVLVGVALLWAGEECRSTIVSSGEECSGFEQLAYDNDWLIIALIVAGILGVFGIRQYEDHMATRPCPRCGRRVAVGDLECPYCDFDFETIGR